MGRTKKVTVQQVKNNTGLLWYVVDRQHVATSNRALLRLFRDRIGKHRPEYTREALKALYRIVLDRHEKNFRLYCQVMGKSFASVPA